MPIIIEQQFDRCWAEVDLSKLKINFEVLTKHAAGAIVIPVIKANAYGHGALAVAFALSGAGADRFAVASFEEAMQLRRGGIASPILVLSYTNPNNAKLLASNNLQQTVFSLDYAKKLSLAAVDAAVSLDVHFKLDTGMSRIGFNANNDFEKAAQQLQMAATLPNLLRAGLFTHLAAADSSEKADIEYTIRQHDILTQIAATLEQQGIKFNLLHCCNSAGLIAHPTLHLDAVRPGLALYGHLPSSETVLAGLQPILTFKANVIMVKDVDKGTLIGYGCSYKTTQKSKIATLAAGYADGYPRPASNNATVSIHGMPAKVVGRVCMDQIMVDVSDIPQTKAGDTAVLFGDNVASSVEFLAQLRNSINYELLCSIGMRVPRVYIDGSKPVTVCDYLNNSF